jgi:hypothetical protein
MNYSIFFLHCMIFTVHEVLSSSRYLESTISSFTCMGSNYAITRNDSALMSARFQRWIHWRQNLPSICKAKRIEMSTQYGFGLGASIGESIRKMVGTIELGEILSCTRIKLRCDIKVYTK